MKIRNGFVSNSSSSSFVINKDDLDQSQIYKIINHIEYANMKGFNCGYMAEEDAWIITIENGLVRGETYMTNFNMREFFENIGVDNSKVTWSE